MYEVSAFESEVAIYGSGSGSGPKLEVEFGAKGVVSSKKSFYEGKDGTTGSRPQKTRVLARGTHEVTANSLQIIPNALVEE